MRILSVGIKPSGLQPVRLVVSPDHFLQAFPRKQSAGSPQDDDTVVEQVPAPVAILSPGIYCSGCNAPGLSLDGGPLARDAPIIQGTEGGRCS